MMVVVSTISHAMAVDFLSLLISVVVLNNSVGNGCPRLDESLQTSNG